MLLWQLVMETGKDVCFRCGKKIENIDDFSIEHKESCGLAEDPKAAFFDLANIAFSHLCVTAVQMPKVGEHTAQPGTLTMMTILIRHQIRASADVECATTSKKKNGNERSTLPMKVTIQNNRPN